MKPNHILALIWVAFAISIAIVIFHINDEERRACTVDEFVNHSEIKAEDVKP